MKVTGKELNEMRERVANGTADDNDRRLVELYGTGDDETPGVTVRDGEQAVGILTATGTAEVVKGDSAQTAPRKRTRGPAR